MTDNNWLMVNGKVVRGKPPQEELDRAKAQFANRGGQVTQVAAHAAHGVKPPRGVPSAVAKGTRPKAEPITTGDKKYDMYINALPPQVRKVVADRGLDPREVYKEYRSLKKEGLLAKYCPAE